MHFLMKFLRDFDFKNKRVLVRVDFNVPLNNDGQVNEKGDWRLEAALPTINYLLKEKAKIILLTHLGRPNGKKIQELSLEPVARRLEKLLNQKVIKLDDCLGPEVEEQVRNLQAGQIVLLENLRFHPEEEANQPDFAKSLAGLGEIYVDDAFGSIHRAHASIAGLPQYLPSCAGLLLEREIKVLSRFLDVMERPLTAIIGGAKISTKIRLVEDFLNKADNLILGGALANTVISAKGIAIGKSVVEKAMVEEVKKLELTNTKLHIPVDVVVSTDVSGKQASRIAPVGKTKEDELILDIGPDTSQLFQRIISQSKMIIWNGPMGLFEVEAFASGSKAIARAVAQSRGFAVVGGGDTIALLEEMNLLEEMDHVSTGGGSLLKFLSGDKLPGLEALQ